MTIAGLLLFVWQSGNRTIQHNQQQIIRELRAEFLTVYAEGGTPLLQKTIMLRLRSEGAQAPVVVLTDNKGKKLAGNLDAAPPLPSNPDAVTQTALFRSGGSELEHFALTTTVLAGGQHLLIGLPVDRDLDLQARYEEMLLAALLLSIPLALLIAILMARIVGRPVQVMAETARRVSSGALDARVPSDGSQDGFDQLATELNRMLAQIENLVGELRVITAGLAHDLRSPVTRMKAVIESAAAHSTDPASLAALERVSQEADSLNGILTSALEISRIDAGIGRERFASLPLQTLLTDIAELYEPLAEGNDLSLSVDAPENIHIMAHRELLSQALGNLIDNAIKYADGADHIRIFAHRTDAGVAVGVADNGRGIPTDQRDQARRRFGRLDPSRHLPGSGLGLALVESVAQLHNGTIALTHAAPGLIVTLLLPLTEPE